jgi:5-deoxy-glucuronate isomerase
MKSPLLIKPTLGNHSGVVHRITPGSAGWSYVGFEVFDLRPNMQVGDYTQDREACLVILCGQLDVSVDGQSFPALGGRRDPFEGNPTAVYIPPRANWSARAQSQCEFAIGYAPATGNLPARVIVPSQIGQEVRGTGTNTRFVRNVLPESAAAERLLVVEVITPGGHWSSYPPHKHDTSGRSETQLEETYYHRLAHRPGFAFQRVYTDDRSLDETMTVEDRDVVLVPRGYHPVGAPHGQDLYYLNVMAGPTRGWQFTTEPGFEHLIRPVPERP